MSRWDIFRWRTLAGGRWCPVGTVQRRPRRQPRPLMASSMPRRFPPSFPVQPPQACAALCSHLPVQSAQGAPHWGAPSTRAGRRDKSFCPCQKTGENTGFSPVFFLHVLCENGIHSGSDCWFLYLVLSVSNRSHPLQHQKHTRFRLFRAFPGAFFSFSLFLGRKIFACSFVHPAA